MDPNQLQAMVQVVQVLIAAGYALGEKIAGMVHALHPDLSPAERDALCDAIMADDAVRAALAAQAAGIE